MENMEDLSLQDGEGLNKRMELMTGTVLFFTVTVSFMTVPVNKELFTGTLSVNNSDTKKIS